MFISKNISLINEGADEKDFHAMYFDGKTLNAINCGSASSLDVGTGSFSVSVWYKVVNVTGTQIYFPIVSKGRGLTDSGNGWCVTHINDGSGIINKIYFDTVAGGVRKNEITGTNSVSFNTWTHLACVFSNASDTLSVYINGVLASTPGVGDIADLGDGSNIFYIGRETGTARQFEGYISDVAYYRVALDASTISTIYNNGNLYDYVNGVVSNKLKGWWRPGNGAPNMIGTGDIIPDLSGTGNDGTVENSFTR